jgi:hypothetical protein
LPSSSLEELSFAVRIDDPGLASECETAGEMPEGIHSEPSQRKRGATARLNLRNTAPVLDPTGISSENQH